MIFKPLILIGYFNFFLSSTLSAIISSLIVMSNIFNSLSEVMDNNTQQEVCLTVNVDSNQVCFYGAV